MDDRGTVAEFGDAPEVLPAWEERFCATPARFAASLLSLLWVVSFAVLAVIYQNTPWERWLSFSQFGLVGILAFWVVSGSGAVWVRVLITALFVAVCTVTAGIEASHRGAILSLVGATTVGNAYLARMAFSIITAKGGEWHRFSMLRLMLITAFCAAVIFGIGEAVPWREMRNGLGQLAVACLALSLIALMISLQCLTLLTRNWKQFAAVFLLAVITAAAAPFLERVAEAILLENATSLETLLSVYWVTAGSVWLILFPLEFGLRGLGWSVIGQVVPEGDSPRGANPERFTA